MDNQGPSGGYLLIARPGAPGLATKKRLYSHNAARLSCRDHPPDITALNTVALIEFSVVSVRNGYTGAAVLV